MEISGQELEKMAIFQEQYFGEENGGVIKINRWYSSLYRMRKKTFEYHRSSAFTITMPLTQQDTNSRTQPNRFNVEPEDQLSRFQHFNYLPLIEVPKLNSSQSSQTTALMKVQ